MPDTLLHPANLLGRGTLPNEKALIDSGYRFVTTLLTERKRKRPLLLCGRRSPVEAGTALLQSALRCQVAL